MNIRRRTHTHIHAYIHTHRNTLIHTPCLLNDLKNKELNVSNGILNLVDKVKSDRMKKKKKLN